MAEAQAHSRGGVRNIRIWLFLLPGVLGAMLYGTLAATCSTVWSNEAFSLGMVRLGYREIWNLPSVDVHPPLYYYYLKTFLLVFGDSLVSARVASVLPAMFILLFGGWQIRRLRIDRTGLLFMACFLAFPSILIYAFEVRMYSLAAAFVFADAVFAYRCWLSVQRGDWFWLAFCSVCAAYTHYYAFLIVGLIDLALLILLVRKRRDTVKRWFLSFGLMALLYLPWCGHMIGQIMYTVGHEYWIKKITLRTICGYAYKTFAVEGSILFTVVLAAAYLALLLWAFRKKRGKAMALLLLPILVAAIGVTVSAIVRPAFVFRYLIPSLCMLPVFAAAVLDQMYQTPGYRRLAVGILSILLIAGGINAFNRVVKESTVPENAYTKAWVERQDCDTYLVISAKTHASTVLTFFENEKPIYSNWIESGEANPFSNIRSMETFHPTGEERILLLLDEGADPSEGLPEGYGCRYREQIVERDGCIFDVYELLPHE